MSGGRRPQHHVRALEALRRRWRNGEQLPSETDAAVHELAKSLARGRRGGWIRCNGIERHLLFDMALCGLIRNAVLDEVDRRGGSLFTDKGGLLPVFAALATFMNTSRLHALALGIRPDLAGSPESIEVYFTRKARRAKKEALAAPASAIEVSPSTPAPDTPAAAACSDSPAPDAPIEEENA